MKAKISKLSIVLASAALSFSGLLIADTTSVQVGAGYRQDSLTSSVSQRSSLNPRAKSRLHFRDVEIAFIGVKAKSTFGCCEAYGRADFDYGWVLDGKLRESLTLKNRNSNTQFGHNGYLEEGEYLDVILRNDIKNKSFVWDLDLAYVYPLHCWCDELMVGPAIGFTMNRQHLHAKNHININDASISESDRSEFGLGSGSGCGNSNRTSWWGPWIGFDFAYNSQDCWNVYGEFEIHIGRVRHSRDANVDLDFIDHLNSTKSFWGPSIKIGTTHVFCENWYADASLYYSKFYTYNSSNDIKWATGNIRLDVGYTF